MPSPQNTAPRDSFLFVRLGLALTVIFGHCFPLAPFGEEPLGALCKNQLSPEGLAVKGFFILSGYLLMQSWTRQPSLMRFTIRRLFRIMPAFWVCLLVTSFVVVPAMFNVMSRGQIGYWEGVIGSGERTALTYLTNNVGLYITQWSIPPIFFDNKYPRVLNGSLWSLFYEALCYAGLALAGVLGMARRRLFVLAGFALLYVPCVIFAFRPFPGFPITHKWDYILNQGFHPNGQGVMLAFVAGVTLSVMTGGKFTWSPKYFGIAATALVISMLAGGFALVWPIALPYVLLSLCYKLPFHAFGRFGDFSYGTYLYAFLIQQCLYALGIHENGFAAYFGLAVALSLACGVLSWIVVERPAIALGARLIRLLPSAENSEAATDGAGWRFGTRPIPTSSSEHTRPTAIPPGVAATERVA